MSNENRKMVNLNDRQGRLLKDGKALVAKKMKDQLDWTGTLYEGDVCGYALEVLLGRKHFLGSKDHGLGQ